MEQTQELPPEKSIIQRAFRWMKQNKIATAALFVIATLYILGITAEWIAPYDPLRTNLDETRQGPSWDHWLGTDRIGRDMFSRALFALRPIIGITAASFLVGGGLFGVFLGMLAGLRRGWVDTVVMRVGETTYALPGLLLMIFLTASLRPRYESVMDEVLAFGPLHWASGWGAVVFLGVCVYGLLVYVLAGKFDAPGRQFAGAGIALVSLGIVATTWLIGIAGFTDFFLIFLVFLPFSWYGSARIMRAQTLALREEQFIEAARAIGASDFRILTHHIFPNVLPLFIVGASAGLGAIAGAEVSLTWLGLGVQQPNPSFGLMISEAGTISALRAEPILILIPFAFVTTFMLAFNLLGDALSSNIVSRDRASS